jgi:flagellar hook-basal body complex protein FliE
MVVSFCGLDNHLPTNRNSKVHISTDIKSNTNNKSFEDILQEKKEKLNGIQDNSSRSDGFVK